MTAYDKLYDDYIKLKNDYEDLSDKYVKQSRELADLIISQSFGVIFTWSETGETEFYPIFQTVRGLKKNGERPNHFQLNFDQNTLAEWITQCNATLGASTPMKKVISTKK